MDWIIGTVVIYITLVMTLPCFCNQLKLFQEDLRMSDASVVKTARSLTECAATFVTDVTSSSFSYNKAEQVCELSGNYPEQSSTAATGWKVYAPIVNGIWSAWSNWQTCPVSCSGGTIKRTRSCDNPSASNGGMECEGDSEQTQSCNGQPCPINGGWSPWNDWETCPVTCGDGTITRTRSCDNPPPNYGGDDCQGDSEQSNSCNEQHCPINGEWSVWTNWGTCSLACGGGMMTSTRFCNNPPPNYGGMDCQGDSEQSQSCNEQQCPINGGWSLWTSWSVCSITCGDTKARTRSCNNPPASNGGTQCSGLSSDYQACDGPCFSASNYYISSFKTSWNNAKSACTGMNKELVRINSQDEQNFIQGLTGVSTMDHWIGLTCSFSVCTWEDGTPANNAWTKWAPGEPGDRACVWVGYWGNSWDDDYCDIDRYYICEN